MSMDHELLKEDLHNSLQINLNNKDLLIVSLLEYICTLHDKPRKIFCLICDYLKQNDILKDDSSYSLKTSDLRHLCMNLIGNLIKNDLLPQINELNDLDHLPPDSKSSRLASLASLASFTCLPEDIDEKDIIENKHNLITEIKYNNFYDSRYSNDFIEIEHLGKGGFGTVYKAFNKLDRSLYAIKKIKIKKLNDEGSNYYLNEARHLAKLTHPNIVRYYNTWIEFRDNCDGEDNDTNQIVSKGYNITPILYIQMELCHMTLREYLTDRNYSGFPFVVEEELFIFKQIIKGLKHIHRQNIIHGDLNPGNIFFDDNMDVKIGDFGLSKKTDKEDNFVNTDSYGNILYMSPENEIDYICNKKSDVYSLGIIFFEIIHKFGTMMERINLINKIKNGSGFQPNLLNHRFKREYGGIEIEDGYLSLIKKMVEPDYKKRLDIVNVNSICKTLDNKEQHIKEI